MLYRIGQRFCMSFWLSLEDLIVTLLTVQGLEGIRRQTFFQTTFYTLEAESEFEKFMFGAR